MKKFFSYAVAALMGFVAITELTACGGTGDEPTDDVPTNEVTGYRVRYTVTPGANLMEVADVTLVYTDDTFESTKSVALTADQLDFVTDYPASGKGKEITGEVFMAPKAGVTPDPEAKYAMGAEILIEVWTMYEEGEPTYMSTILPQGSLMTFQGSKLGDLFERYSDKHICFQSYKL